MLVSYQRLIEIRSKETRPYKLGIPFWARGKQHTARRAANKGREGGSKAPYGLQMLLLV